MEVSRRDKKIVAEIEAFLETRAKEGLLRKLRPISARHKGIICFDRKEYIDFSSNDYLGLSHHPRLIEESKKAIDKFGTSSSASRLMSGDFELHHQLEEKTSRFKNKEAALVFNSGYQANLGIISALYGKADCIFSDRLNHASILDGILLSGARFFRFQHNDVGHLKSLLRKERNKFHKALIVTETIFSMDGDRAPLKELVRLKERYNCAIMVDEAHATGIYGRQGAGVVQDEGLEKRVDFIMGTFSKALGGFGAYLAASKKIVQYLINTCRSFIYSTALPPSVIVSDLVGLELARKEPQRRHALLECAEFFRSGLRENGFEVKGNSQIVPLIVGENSRTVKLAKRLQKRGYWVLPIRPPTVPQGQARLRFSLTFWHSREILQRLMDEIAECRI